MSVTSARDLAGISEISEIVAVTLKKMREYASPGINTKELDEYGGSLLNSFGARSAPLLTYGFPGHTCISVNSEVAHGIPSAGKVLKSGDLVNIDVSAERNGYWADNGGSFVLGEDTCNHAALVEASKRILESALQKIRGGVRIAEVGGFIEAEAKKAGFNVIKNLTGHGVGRSLHEEPEEIPCFYDRFNRGRFRKNSVVAVETFISTKATRAYQASDGWTLLTKDGSFVAQHEHTIIVTDAEPIILTQSNGILN